MRLRACGIGTWEAYRLGMHAISSDSPLTDNFPLAASMLVLLDLASCEAREAIESIEDMTSVIALGHLDDPADDSLIDLYHVIASALAIG